MEEDDTKTFIKDKPDVQQDKEFNDSNPKDFQEQRKEKKSTFKVKRMGTNVLQNQETKVQKIEFSDDSDEHNQDDGHSDTKIEKDYLETKEMNDMSSMPRGESVAFAVTDKPYGEINQYSDDKMYEDDEAEFLETVKKGTNKDRL